MWNHTTIINFRSVLEIIFLLHHIVPPVVPQNDLIIWYVYILVYNIVYILSELETSIVSSVEVILI